FKLFNAESLMLGGMFVQKVLQRPICPSVCRPCFLLSLRLIFYTGGIFYICRLLHKLFSGQIILWLTMYIRGISNHSMLNCQASRGFVGHLALTLLTSHRHPVPSLHLLHFLLTHLIHHSHLVLLSFCCALAFTFHRQKQISSA